MFHTNHLIMYISLAAPKIYRTGRNLAFEREGVPRLSDYHTRLLFLRSFLSGASFDVVEEMEALLFVGGEGVWDCIILLCCDG